MPVALYMEYVPSKYRGVMLVALQSFWTFGTMIEVTTSQSRLALSMLLHGKQYSKQAAKQVVICLQLCTGIDQGERAGLTACSRNASLIMLVGASSWTSHRRSTP